MSPKTGILLGTIFIAIALAGFAFRYREETRRVPVPVVSPEPPTAIPDPDTVQQFSTEEVLLEALNNGTPGIVIDRMTDTITFTLYGKNCCGTIRRNQAVPHFAELTGAEGPWSRAENQTIYTILATDPDFGENREVFGSVNDYAVAIRLNTSDRIEEFVIFTPEIFQRQPQQ
ncbi:MAG: hypothetical protein N2691_02305 [Patescibacteria group bacterium]|nr:hypothetical protein [Patescibacteria group bacterium]